MGEARVLDLFSAAAGGWSLGLHRAGYRTVAACEAVAWRRALYAQNNPGIPIYDDVRTLTASRLVRDLGYLPDVVVGSPPCQDISSANTKGKGVEGERSGLFFEAIRIIGEIRDLGRGRGEPAARWFALENSANLRTRGADAVLAALEALGYSCWPTVVRAGDIGANHERPRSWLIGCDVAQVANAHGFGRHEGWRRRRFGLDVSLSQDTDGHPSDADSNAVRLAELSVRPQPQAAVSEHATGDATQDGCGSRLPRGCAGAVAGAEQPARRNAAHPNHQGQHAPSEHGEMAVLRRMGGDCEPGAPADADQAGQADGCVVTGVRQEEVADDGRGARRSADRPGIRQTGLCEADRLAALLRRSDWSLDDLAHHLRLDDGLSAWVADTRIAVSGPRGTSAASLIVEAFGDAVVPQIPEAIGRAIQRVEAAMAAVTEALRHAA